MNNEELIHTFYRSFAEGDANTMAGCYSDDIHFTDPAFGDLYGDDAKNMWRMLVRNSRGQLKISFADVKADDQNGSANWIAEYIFSKTGRHVTNEISSRFEFRDGKISRHIDHFNFWKWSRQALGWKGFLLGWSETMKKEVQRQANASLKKYHAAQ